MRMAMAMRRQPVLASARWIMVGRTIENNPAFHSWTSRSRALSVLPDSSCLRGMWNDVNDNNKSNSKHHYTFQHARFFCAAAPSPKDPDDKDDGFINRTLKMVLTPQIQFYALVAGGTIGAYGISRVFLAFTNFFTHLTPTTVAKWGFYTGFGCATVVGGLALVTADNMYIRADPVYRYCLNWVKNDTIVQKSLGDGIQPGSLRSYRLDSGKIELVGRNPVWRPPRIQMIFDVTATGPPYRTGIVTCEAIKSGGFPPKLTTTLLKIDYETGNEGEEGGTREEDQTYFLKGSQEDFSRVSRRSGLSLDMLARSVHINKAAAGRQE